MDNRTIAQALVKHARQLEMEQANLYRINAYRRAAATIRALDTPVAEMIAKEGFTRLKTIPGIGRHMAFAIERLVVTGDFHALHEGPEAAPAHDLVENQPGVGPHLAELLWEKLAIRTLSQLAQAEQNKLVGQLPLQPNQRQVLADAVADWQQRQTPQVPAGEPTVADLLAIDHDYRDQAEEGRLPRITPHGQNPDQLKWLPLLSTHRAGWNCRALFSNTALAHRLGVTHDWVVIYFRNDQAKGQRTVVTEVRGDLRGRRVVRGREEECRLHYNHQEDTVRASAAS
jgi:hypothetical protein